MMVFLHVTDVKTFNITFFCFGIFSLIDSRSRRFLFEQYNQNREGMVAPPWTSGKDGENYTFYDFESNSDASRIYFWPLCQWNSIVKTIFAVILKYKTIKY